MRRSLGEGEVGVGRGSLALPLFAADHITTIVVITRYGNCLDSTTFIFSHPGFDASSDGKSFSFLGLQCPRVLPQAQQLLKLAVVFRELKSKKSNSSLSLEVSSQT